MTRAVKGVFPPGAKMLIVGPAPSRDDERYGRPFSGPYGKELDEWLRLAGVHRMKVGLTHFINHRLPDDDFNAALQPDPCGDLPPVRKGKFFLRPEFHKHLARLEEEIAGANPNILVAIGPEALWALTGSYELSRLRGTIMTANNGRKTLATYHPMFVVRNGRKMRSVCAADMLKASKNSHRPEFERIERRLWLDPTISDLWAFKEQFLDRSEVIFLDIETNPKLKVITHVAFAGSPTEAICVPFIVGGRSYWPTAAEEVAAVKFVKTICGMPQKKALQNGLYDLRWLWEYWRIPVMHYCHDTRLLFHAIFPDLPKNLGFIGSLTTNEQAWKLLGHSDKKDD